MYSENNNNYLKNLIVFSLFFNHSLKDILN